MAPFDRKGWFIVIAFWLAVALGFVLVFNLWPEFARSNGFRFGAAAVVIVCAMILAQRLKAK